MKSDNTMFALIPARGCSKGIKNKNISPVFGKPLIEYTIEAALQSRYLNGIHLNTDSFEIKEACKNFNINTEYNRPRYLASDSSSTVETVVEWIRYLKKKPDVLVLLQPTSPLRTARLIDDAIASFISSNRHSLVGVHHMIEHPYKCIKQLENKWVYLEKNDAIKHRRQDYEKNYYVINGSIYIVSVDWFLENNAFVKEKETELFVTSKEEGIDIDDMLDVYFVEAILKHRQESNS